MSEVFISVTANLAQSFSEKIGNFVSDFQLNFIEEDRWKYLASGLVETLKITAVAVCIGIFLGFLIAVVRSSYDKSDHKKSPTFIGAIGSFFFKFINGICKLYLTVIRGTPVVVQLMIIYYVIFASVNINKTFVAIVAFGLNSSAYVAEIVRSGIMSVDKGQFEAGRSVGFTYSQTMKSIVLPQALKNVLPALGNEFIVLLKETSVAGYIAIQDLTRGADIIRSQTYSPLMPLFAIALVYLVIVVIMTSLVNKLERKLRTSDH